MAQATFQISDLAEEMLNGHLGPEDILDVGMLEDIDAALKKIQTDMYSGVKIARTRKLVLERIVQLTQPVTTPEDEDFD